MSSRDPVGEVAPGLSRSASFELFLDTLNRALADAFPAIAPDTTDHGSVQIAGLPRSGTTLLYQLLARSGLVGYPSNLMALFWRVPWVGARIQVALTKPGSSLSLESFAGRTPEPLDPHEFGYFWRSAMGHDENCMRPSRADIDWRALQRALREVAAVFGKPVVYKNFLALAHAGEIVKHMPGDRLLVTERDIVDVAASLLSLRRAVGADAGAWVGPSPEPGPPPSGLTEHQVVAYQVMEIERCRQLALRNSGRMAFVADYARLCDSPSNVLQEVLEFLGLDADAATTAPPGALARGSGMSGLDRADQRLLEAALADQRAAHS